MPEESRDETPTRRYRWRYGPLRLIAPWIAAAVGVFLLVRGIVDLQTRGEPLFIFVGAGLTALAIVFFFVYKWMAKRGV
ncbi:MULTISPECIES: hypothetical protein [unclassified Microbacterium]|uniref:hypothetical protein n=1 Tax=unclassified Microbacterium TaxID=2609290 RepID=UPI0011C479CA|nr:MULTISPECIES: hypothetical protein [unclassified Microbacterium]MBT2486076.1 hypothetical protein [Microbacterium sp. ISL-108]